MELEFDVKITASDLYDYMLYHTYTSFTGIFGTFAAVLALYSYAVTHYFLYIIASVVLIAYIPCALLIRANRQVINTPVFKEPLHYMMNDEGITVSQGESKDSQSWESCVKAVSTPRSIILYTSKTTASIFPKRDLADKKDALIRMISAHMPPDKVKIRF